MYNIHLLIYMYGTLLYNLHGNRMFSNQFIDFKCETNRSSRIFIENIIENKGCVHLNKH